MFLAGRSLAKLDAADRETRAAGGVAKTAQIGALDERSVDGHADAGAAWAGALREGGLRSRRGAVGRAVGRAVVPRAHELVRAQEDPEGRGARGLRERDQPGVEVVAGGKVREGRGAAVGDGQDSGGGPRVVAGLGQDPGGGLEARAGRVVVRVRHIWDHAAAEVGALELGKRAAFRGAVGAHAFYGRHPGALLGGDRADGSLAERVEVAGVVSGEEVEVVAGVPQGDVAGGRPLLVAGQGASLDGRDTAVAVVVRDQRVAPDEREGELPAGVLEEARHGEQRLPPEAPPEVRDGRAGGLGARGPEAGGEHGGLLHAPGPPEAQRLGVGGGALQQGAVDGVQELGVPPRRLGGAGTLVGVVRILVGPAALGPTMSCPRATIAFGNVLAKRGDLTAARSKLETGLSTRTELPRISPWPTLIGLLTLARVHFARGDRGVARRLLDEARAILEPFGDDAGIFPALLECQERRLRKTKQQDGLLDWELTERELAVLRLLDGKLTTRQMGDSLYVAPSTVRTHVKSIYRKLGVSTRKGAVEEARARRLVQGPRPKNIP